MEAYLSFFAEGYKLFKEHIQLVKEAKLIERKDVETFDAQVQQWNEKRIMLESQLHRGAFPFNSKQRILETMSQNIEKVTVQSSKIERDPSIIHEGYLYKKSSNVRKKWKRRWFVLRGDELRYYRSWKDFVAHSVCDMLLSTVRQVNNPDLRCCFEIISPNRRPYMLQAVNENDMKAWMEAIRRATESQLVKQQQRSSLSRTGEDDQIPLLLATNDTCAECRAVGPDWVSINLGVVICIECSGIHRSLGTHLSKVRSLGLDRLPSSQVQLLRRLGNDSVNQVFENSLDSSEKPTPTEPQEVKEKFIRKKYEEKKFLKNLDIKCVKDYLFESIESDDIQSVLWCIAKGVNLEWKSDSGLTVMEVAEAKSSPECIELLKLNGVK